MTQIANIDKVYIKIHPKIRNTYLLALYCAGMCLITKQRLQYYASGLALQCLSFVMLTQIEEIALKPRICVYNKHLDDP